jgi:hypothetical protein
MFLITRIMHNFKLILIALILFKIKAQITGSVTASPSTVQEDGAYTFSLNMNNFILGGGYIEITFPTDYDFSFQATTSETKTCTGISGIYKPLFFSDLT